MLDVTESIIIGCLCFLDFRSVFFSTFIWNTGQSDRTEAVPLFVREKGLTKWWACLLMVVLMGVVRCVL